MGSSSADVLRSLDLASCAAELAVGSLHAELDPAHHFPQVHNPMPAQPSIPSQHHATEPQQQEQQSKSEQGSGQMDGSNGLLLPKGNLVMKLLQVSPPCYIMSFLVVSRVCLRLVRTAKQ